MAKILQFNEEARRSLERGVDILANTVKVTLGDVERDAIAVVVNATRAGGEHLALLRLLFGGVGNDQAGGRGLLCFERLNEDAILERLDRDCHVKPLSHVWFCGCLGWSERRRGAVPAGQPR